MQKLKANEADPVQRGTAIATFVQGKYPQSGSTGMHAAIYLSQNADGIVVLDQWRAQGKVLQRTIPWTVRRSGLSNDGSAFCHRGAKAMNKILSAALLGVAACAACASEELTCPQPIAIKESLNTEAPTGWAARSRGLQRYLAGVSFYDGDPSKDFNLAPDSDKAAGKERIATWTFGKSAEPIWLVCRYLDTGMVLQKPLAKGLAQCQVRYKEGGIVTSVSCK